MGLTWVRMGNNVGAFLKRGVCAYYVQKVKA